MYVFLSILIFLASIFLILIVLVQNSKGGGLASGFSSSNQIMGVRKTTDFLEKATWGLAGTVVVLSVIIASFIPHEGEQKGQQQESEIQQQVNDAVPVDPNAMGPDFGSQQQQQQPAEAPAGETPAQQQQEEPAK